jgi:hypothetical protein
MLLRRSPATFGRAGQQRRAGGNFGGASSHRTSAEATALAWRRLTMTAPSSPASAQPLQRLRAPPSTSSSPSSSSSSSPPAATPRCCVAHKARSLLFRDDLDARVIAAIASPSIDVTRLADPVDIIGPASLLGQQSRH